MSYDPTRVAADYKAKQSASQTEDLPMFRASDPDTSREAAERIAPVLSELQALVRDAVQRHGAMTAVDCENLPEFKVQVDDKPKYAPSTIRHRLTDLERMGKLVIVGKRDGCRVYDLAERATNRGDVAA